MQSFIRCPRLNGVILVAVAVLISVGFLAQKMVAAEPPDRELDIQFVKVVQPFLTRFCFDCHGAQKQEAKLDLSQDSSRDDVVKNYRIWDIVVERLNSAEMPPAEYKNQPSAAERQSVVDWVRAVQREEAVRHAGDPGLVLARRLSHAEYDNTIRDLTGFDLRPTKEFPVDPANESGFDNSGESLTMSPALVKKYLTAARFVSEHVVLKPNGFVFAPHPVVTETDRDKYCVQQIVSFYRQHEVDYADYFFAAWRYRHREQLGQPHASLSDFAFPIRNPEAAESAIPVHKGNTAKQEQRLSLRYLQQIWLALTEPDVTGPLAEIQAAWNKIPSDPSKIQEIRLECQQLKDLVIKLRKEFDTRIEKLHVKGNSDGSQPLILWWNRQIALNRTSYVGDGKDPDRDAAISRFCCIFPNAFSVSSRGHYADPKLGAQVRLLTAGFHLMQGYFRDDLPLYQLVLEDQDRGQLDEVWQNLNYVTRVPFRQYKDFLFFERAEPPQFAGGPEFDFARPEDKDVTSVEKLARMRSTYVEKARKNGASETAIEAIETYFTQMSSDFRWIETTQATAESSHLNSLLQFAERAYRRPLSSSEREELLAFYRHLRTEDGLGHEEAIRDSIASILLSPCFCFRYDLNPPEDSVQPLTDFELASRLSYFLWSSMPDDELLLHAKQGDLHQPEVLINQVRRMLSDEKIRGLAMEFAGNWLEFRRFEELNSVDRERFPSFTSELRAAMYEEPIRLFIDIVSRNRSILDLISGSDTFVNTTLASHYGIDLSTGEKKIGADEWFHIEDARDAGRGGLLPMSVFLTKNSPGLRTSPVKRGYWVVRRLLGEHIPAPPPVVAELPKDEATLGELTLPQLLARHRSHQACSGCHQRFDSIGLVFENYGPIGERRDRDLGGRPVDARAQFPDGVEGVGVDGLRSYLARSRRNDFTANFSRKLLSYALGRSLLLSDQPTLDRMSGKLVAAEFRIQPAIETIVTCPQFLNKR